MTTAKSRKKNTDAQHDELIARGAELAKMEDQHGDTKSGWWIDGVYLGKTTRDAIEALAIAN